jgi:hypothetical protein
LLTSVYKEVDDLFVNCFSGTLVCL